MKHKFYILIIFSSFLIGQVYPTGQNYPPPTDLITAPTAGTLMRGSYSLGMRIQDGGGMIMGLRAGITDRFQFGSDRYDFTARTANQVDRIGSLRCTRCRTERKS